MDRIAYGYMVEFLDFHGDTPAQGAQFRRKHTITGAICTSNDNLRIVWHHITLE
jgi:hypothetical protein